MNDTAKSAFRAAPSPSVIFAAAALMLSLGTRSEGAIVLSGGGLTFLEQGPVAALAGDPAPANLASGKTAFALDELGLGTHFIANVTNGTYGNSSSWIGNGATGSEGPFIGVNLGGSIVDVGQIAFGRSNVLGGDACGVCTDRTLGVYTLQYTQVGAPDNSFVTTGDAATGWVTIGTLDYQDPDGLNVENLHQRHLYSFDPVTATGVRLIVPTSGIVGGTAIDEIEIYAVPEPSGIVLLGFGFVGFLLRRRR